MQIQEVIKTINRMQADGVIDRYAIGGAVGATFYLEPLATLDVDIFITFKPQAGSLLVSPQPIFDYLKARGCAMEGEYIVIAGWPVQFLPPHSPLVMKSSRRRWKRMWRAFPPAFSPPNIWQPLLCRPDAPRKGGSCNLWKPARWTPKNSRPFSSGAVWLPPGKNLKYNFSRHEF